MRERLARSARMFMACLFLLLSTNSLILPMASVKADPKPDVICPTGSHLQGNNCKVTICHRTDSATNPYTNPDVDLASVDGDSTNDNGQGDHFAEHQGPVATSETVANGLKDSHTEWGDIIPPVTGVEPGLNWTAEGQAIYNNGCAYIPPTDVCPNIEGVQTEVPEGKVLDENGDCVTDVCPNVEGVQTDEKDCPPPVDVCPNIEGVQTEVPEGKVLDENGDCVTDVCPNINGIQTEVPEGKVLNNDGNCVDLTCPEGSFQQGNNCKVTICHRTDSVTNPYTRNSVDISSVDGNGGNDNGQGDHLLNHTGPVFNSSMTKDDTWGDIIPPVAGVEDGLNWNAEGMAIWNNDCNVPVCPAEQAALEIGDLPVLSSDQQVGEDCDVCPNVPGTQTSEEQCDVCPDTPGTQTSEEDCDVCPNVEGVQTDEKDCPPPVDVCPNIEGTQIEVPEGKVLDEQGNCVVDVCPNIEGVQTELPAGMAFDEQKNCVTPSGEVLGASTTPPPAGGRGGGGSELVNTGSTTLLNLAAGLFLLGGVAGVTLFSRKSRGALASPEFFVTTK
jgi:hypothetical protein